MSLRRCGGLGGLMLFLCLLAIPVGAQNQDSIPAQVTQLQQQMAAAQAQITALTQQLTNLQNLANSAGGLLVVTADCANGGSINAALQAAASHAGPLVVNVRGVCHESVNLQRSDVALNGQTADAAISPSSGDALDINFSNGVTINNLIFENAQNVGVSLWASKAVIWNSTFTNNGVFGLIISDGSTAALNNCTFAGNDGFAAMQADYDSVIDVRGGAIRENRSGIAVMGNSSVNLQGNVDIANNSGIAVAAFGASSVVAGQATIENNQSDAIVLFGGSSLYTGWAGQPLTIQNNHGNGIFLWDTSVARANGPGAVVIQNNTQWGITCVSALGAPAAQVQGPSGGFSVSGNSAGQIGCPYTAF